MWYLWCMYVVCVCACVQSHSNLGPGQYAIKSFLDDWNTEHKKRSGRFFKMDQYPEKAIDRMYAFSLSQNPRNPVSWNFLNALHTQVFYLILIMDRVINLFDKLLNYDRRQRYPCHQYFLGVLMAYCNVIGSVHIR